MHCVTNILSFPHIAAKWFQNIDIPFEIHGKVFILFDRYCNIVHEKRCIAILVNHHNNVLQCHIARDVNFSVYDNRCGRRLGKVRSI